MSDSSLLSDLFGLPAEELQARLDDLLAQGEESVELANLMLAVNYRQVFVGNLGFSYIPELEVLVEKLDYDRGRAWVLAMSGATHFLASRSHQALDSYNRALVLARAVEDDLLEGILYQGIAGSHVSLGNYQTALEYAFKQLERARETGDEVTQGWLLHGVASGSNDLGDHERALDYANQGLELFRNLHDRQHHAQVRSGEARCLIEIGCAYHKLGRLAEAKTCFEESLALFREFDNQIGVARGLSDLGRILHETGRFEEAEAMHIESLEIRRELQLRQSQSTSFLNLGELELARGNPEKAIEHLSQGLTIALETSARLRIYQTHEALANAFEAVGDYEAALNHQREFHRVREDVSSDSINGRIADLQMRFEIERAQQDAEIERLRSVELARLLDELKATQDRLVHTEKMASLGSMTAGIAHEIKNPLNFVNNFASLSVELVEELSETLGEQLGSDAAEVLDDLRSNSVRISEHGRRADSIIKNMLLHAGGKSVPPRPIDLNQLVKEYVGLAYHGVRAADSEFNVDIQYDLDPDVREVVGAPQDLGRVILNLLGNAFDALKSAGTDRPVVAISTRPENGGVILTVSDNGPGIPDEVQGRIFEPFYTTKPAGDGTGLGLSLSYDIVVKGHGGDLRLESKPGRTTFTVELPGGTSE